MRRTLTCFSAAHRFVEVVSVDLPWCFRKHLHMGTRGLNDKVAHLFESSDIAEKYAQYRPTYPVEVPTAIVDYSRKTIGKLNFALDVGCGSGQSTLHLLKYFRRAAGIDISEQQILQARKAYSVSYPELTFFVGPAENLHFQPTGSVDLVTVAQAMHWIDLDKFYGEVNRVLRPGGTLAVYGYGNVKLDNEEASDIVGKHYKALREYFEAGRRHVDEHYQAFTPLPFEDFQRLDHLEIRKPLSLAAFMGYLSSWSAYEKYLKLHPGSQVLGELEERLLAVYSSGSGHNLPAQQTKVVASWPIFMLLGRKPGTSMS